MYGTFNWWHCNDARGSICNGSGGFNPPPSKVVDRAIFGVAGPTLSGQVGGATGVVPEWHAHLTTCARLVRADKGRFCLCPIGPVGHLGIQECWRGYKGPMGRRSGECMGGGNLGMCVCKHTAVRFLFFLAPRSLQAEKAKGQGGPPWPFSRGCQTYLLGGLPEMQLHERVQSCLLFGIRCEYGLEKMS